MTREVFFRPLRYATMRTLLGMLSAFLGAEICWIVMLICSPGDPRATPMPLHGPVLSLLAIPVVAAVFGAASLFIGSTGLLLYLALTIAIRNLLPWRNRLLFILGSTLAGFLGVLLDPLPALWRFPQIRPTVEDWRLCLLGTSIGLISGCIFLLRAHRMRSRIQGTS